jgi:hypothetical protein
MATAMPSAAKGKTRKLIRFSSMTLFPLCLRLQLLELRRCRFILVLVRNWNPIGALFFAAGSQPVAQNLDML